MEDELELKGNWANVLQFCDCVRKNDIARAGKKNALSTRLDKCNKVYGAHFFDKHKDVIVKALEEQSSLSDVITLTTDALKRKENVIVCFECKRLFYDTVVDDSKKGRHGGGAANLGKKHTFTKETKFAIHNERMNCTPETRLKALHKFICFESGSEVLKARLTAEEKIGLIDDRKRRGRPMGWKKPAPTAIETIKIVELPGESSEELKKWKTQAKMYEMAYLASVTYSNHIISLTASSKEINDAHEQAKKLESDEKDRLFEEAIEDGSIEDTPKNRDDFDFI